MSLRSGVRQMFEGMRTGFPDFQIVPEDMIAEGDKVFVRATIRGTQRGGAGIAVTANAPAV